MKILLIISAFLHLTACSTFHSYDFLSQEEIKSHVSSKASTLPAYDLTGGIWLENQPLLVNKEFNFGAAMAIEGVGPAIAVGMRNKKNEELVELLSQLPPLQLGERFQGLGKKYSSRISGKQRIAVYGILYGQPSAHLRTILELHDPSIDSSNDDNLKQNVQRYIVYSNWLPVSGDGSWTENNGTILWDYFDRSIAQLIETINRKPLLTTLDTKKQEMNYSIKGGESVQRGKGFIIDKSVDMTIIQSTTIPNTLLIVPNNDLAIENNNEAAL